MSENMNASVLCGANSYEEKYYFNDKYANLPTEIKNELKAGVVLLTEEAGGIVTLEFLEDGTLVIRTHAAEYDYYYDEIEAGLAVEKWRETESKLMESLELYYRTFFFEGTEK